MQRIMRIKVAKPVRRTKEGDGERGVVTGDSRDSGSRTYVSYAMQAGSWAKGIKADCEEG